MKADFSNKTMLSQFEQEVVAKAITDTRLATILATGAFSAFALLDYLVYRQFL
jgi:hypothetical protein